ncbi:hypothetical protein FH969_15030 [Miniimonas arenae]|uniref:Uncharacterized protein n=1 Tax=Miniimonas arenae TaxID=676201 RepID=A0A5C5B8F1_9MICO|nr:hypothetical protein FH969_15030 [Miniimonas arenae]
MLADVGVAEDGAADGGALGRGIELWCAAVPFSDSPYAQGGPDQVVLGLRSSDGVDTEVARVDGRLLSTEVAGGFTGRMIGTRASGRAAPLTLTRFAYAPGSD